MKRILRLLTILTFFAYGAQAQNINLLDITSGKYSPKDVEAICISADEEFYYQANATNTQIVKYVFRTGKAVETVFDVATAKDCNFMSFEGFVMSPDENRLLLYHGSEMIYRHSFKANYYYFDIRRNKVRKLSENKDKQSVPVFSRDGRMAAYVINNNIWLAKFDFDSESQITTDGEYGKIINGATDWVYEEEFATTQIMDFSSDNNLLAFARFDESEVKEFAFQTFTNQLYPKLFSYKYPKAGEKNSKISVKVFEIDNRRIRDIDIPNDDIEYIPRIEFFPEGDNLAVMTLNRNQNDFRLYAVNARSTVVRQILEEKNDRYIDSELIHSITFFNDQFVYLSEIGGYSHIHLKANTGVSMGQLTSGSYDVSKLLAIDPKEGIVYYQATQETPLQREIYSIDIKKKEKKKISSKAGYNTAQFTKYGKYFISNYSNISTPNYISLHDSKGKEIRLLNDNSDVKNSIARLNLAKKEFVKLKAADGTTELNAYILKPNNFNPSKRYPLVMVQYSGPNSQQVLDKFRVDWIDYLTTQGYVVACVDGRGTGARGEKFRKCNYLNLGIIESDDQIEAAKQLGKLAYIDASKIAIWGWSYGGYNVLMAMSRSQGIFNSGIAIAPVTDWKFYDTVYGERFMRSPEQNMHGYFQASPINIVNKMNGNLLLIHGSADDNVHLQNTIDYSQALIEADKHFEVFVFPDKNHSILGASTRNYLYTKVINFLDRSMQ